jgi:diguanylate cyclase (GGDEF)-like protein
MTRPAPLVDLLTGAYSRSHFEELLARAVTEATRKKSALSLMRIDVDDLQEHADVLGREGTDKALGWLAETISNVLDGRGAIGRVGDDELAVCLVGVGREEALGLADRLCKEVHGVRHEAVGAEYRLTISVGVATLRPGEPWGNLAEAAEEACVNAKQAGRDGAVAR